MGRSRVLLLKIAAARRNKRGGVISSSFHFGERGGGVQGTFEFARGEQEKRGKARLLSAGKGGSLSFLHSEKRTNG